jgi:hypothetical protein
MGFTTTLLLLGAVLMWCGTARQMRVAVKTRVATMGSLSILVTLVGFGLVVVGTMVEDWRDSLLLVGFLPAALYAAFDAGLARSTRQLPARAASD